jgi:hypothetical protein
MVTVLTDKGKTGLTEDFCLPDPTKHLLLMTATITPGDAPDLTRSDPKERLEDYKGALDFYLTLIDRPLHGIVFVENSNSDVTALREVAALRGLTDRIEFLCNYGDYRYTAKGRAYGEFKLLDYATSSSRMLREATLKDLIWKVTGRYKVKNLRSLIANAPIHFDLYVDMKDHPMRWMDTRLMAWTAGGYDRLLRGVADELDSKLREDTMRDYVPTRARGAGLIQRFSREPLVDGIRGYDSRNYSEGRNLIKFYLRSMGRILVPWYWI